VEHNESYCHQVNGKAAGNQTPAEGRRSFADPHIAILILRPCTVIEAPFQIDQVCIFWGGIKSLSQPPGSK